MANQRLLRLVVASLGVLTMATGLLLQASAAAARVSIVPGHERGGGTETFAVRLANERADTATTRLELVLPRNHPIAFTEVAPTPGWTATIRPRALAHPIETTGGQVREAAAAIVWEGGSVPPGQFTQFLVTMGPLPRNGELVFEVIQGYADGSADRWTEPRAPGERAPGAPVITLGSGPVQRQDRQGGQQVSAPSPPPAPSAEVTDVRPAAGSSGGGTDLLLWVLLASALGVVVATGVLARRARSPVRAVPGPEQPGHDVASAATETADR